MIIGTLLALGVAMILTVLRLVTGPTLYDRVLAVNAFGTKTILLLAVLGFAAGWPEFLDIALLYALINFVATIAILKFFRYHSFQNSLYEQTSDEAEKEASS